MYEIGGEAFVSLDPGESVTDRIELRAVDFAGSDRPGRYTISYPYTIDRSGSTYRRAAVMAEFCAAEDLWIGRIESNSITVTKVDAVADLRRVITQDAWRKAVSSDPRMVDEYVYRFLTDGTYQKLHLTDYVVPLEEGTWRLIQDDRDLIHLLLDSETAEAMYWLQADSLIEYHALSDQLIIFGHPYVYQQTMSRVTPDDSVRWRFP